MPWIKRNLKFLGWGVCALALVWGAGGYLYSKWELNDRNLDNLKRTYSELNLLNQKESRQDTATEQKQANGKVAVDALNITFRAVGQGRVSPDANAIMALEVVNEIKSSPYFDSGPDTRAIGQMTQEVPLTDDGSKSITGEPAGTFSFKVVAKLKHPLRL